MSPYDTEQSSVAEPPPLFPSTATTINATTAYTPPTTFSGNNNNRSNSRSNSNNQGRYARVDRQRFTRHSVVDGSFGSVSARFARDSPSVLNRVKERLPSRVQPWFWLGLWFTLATVIIGLAIKFYPRIFAFLEALAAFIKGLGALGPVVVMLCLFATSFPPLVGYSSIVTMSGYIYGFMLGFVIVYTSALAGSIVCFYLCRRWFKGQVRQLMARNKNLKSVVRTVEKRGFRLLVLIRLAPYPFNIMNALLSATHIPLHTYAFATALSLVKLALHVYIGSTLYSLTGGDDGGQEGEPQGHGKAVKILVLVLGVILGIGVGGYVWVVAKREIAITEASRLERRRKRRQASLRRALDEHAASSNLRTSGSGSGSGQGLGLGLSLGQDDSDGFNNVFELSGQRHHADPTRSFLDRERDLLQASSDMVVEQEEQRRGYRAGYHEEEEEDEEGGHEQQSLFGRLNFGRQRQQPSEDWRNVGANVDSSTESDEDSDFLDDDDDDGDDLEEDEERLVGAGRGRDGRFGEEEEEQQIQGERRRVEEVEYEEALDFSALHADLDASPWNEEGDGGEVDSVATNNGEDLLGIGSSNSRR